MMERIFLSIIVPVYNTEKYLTDCLDSLLDQNIPSKQYEIICVDDGSTDGSPQILDKYAKEHENVYVIHKENGGVSSARNLGLDHAKGDYIWFVDSDDCIKPNCLKVLFHLCEEKRWEVLNIAWMPVPDKFSYAELDKTELDPAKIITQIIRLDQSRSLSAAVANTIILRSLIVENSLYFKLGMRIAEDSLFSLHVWEHLKTDVVAIDYTIYYYRDRPGSAIHERSILLNNSTVLNRIAFIRECSQVAEQEKMMMQKSRYRLINTKMCEQMWICLSEFPNTMLPYKETMKELRKHKIFPCPYHKIYFERCHGLRKLVQLFKLVMIYRIPFVYMMYYKWFRNKHHVGK